MTVPQYVTAAPAFGKASNDTKPVTSQKMASPFSIRFTVDERERLDLEAAGRPLGAYIRERLFGDLSSPRKYPKRLPSVDEVKIGRVLVALSQSHLSSNMNQLAKAANMGALPVSPEVEAE